MKVLVTGGAGFLGSNICMRFLNKGQEVICLDNLSTGNKRNVMEFVYNPRFNFVLHDITEPYMNAVVDTVIVSAFPDLNNPLHFLKTCSYGIYTAAGIARRNNSRLIFLSSGKYYGEYGHGISEESTRVLNKGNTVAVGVQMAEEILRWYQDGGLDVRILRVFDSYGPKMSSNSLMSLLIRKALKNEDIVLEERMTSEYSSCFIGDVLNAVSCAADIPEFKGPLNIGASETIYLSDLVEKIVKLTESSSSVEYVPPKKTRIIGVRPNIIRAKNVLHWEPKTNYDKGIKETIKFLREGPSRDYEEVL